MFQPIVLCGGVGNRLWPTSREQRPKQFCKFSFDRTLLRQTLDRFTSKHFLPPIIVTNEIYRFLVNEELTAKERQHVKILLEPSPKNTLPAVLLGTLFSALASKDTTLIFVPSDHWFPDEFDFISLSLKAAQTPIVNKIVTFGIRPYYPETGYGYIEIGSDHGEAKEVVSFVEKPTKIHAQKMISTKDKYLWNSGIFLTNTETVFSEAKALCPAALAQLSDIFQTRSEELNFIRFDESKWRLLENISVDYSLLEKSKNLLCVPIEEKWSDLGSWESMSNFLTEQMGGSEVFQNTIVKNSKNSLCFNNSSNIVAGIVGVDNIIVAIENDAVLITDKSKTQDVGLLVSELDSAGFSAAKNFERTYRPWGNFETLSRGDRFQVKALNVYPHKRLSMQSHKYRSEHWVVVKGTATVTIDAEVVIVNENESVYIEAGQLHRLSNNTDDELIVIETQTGTYFGEDDIKRFDDDFERS
jgi:mannose-1-phosphate guanylyltransferase/mannose-6-phosphate isomerase